MTALTYVSAQALATVGPGTTASSPSFSLASGNHVFVYIKWSGADTALTLADTAGNTYTALTRTHNSTVGGQWFYRLTALGNATNVVTVTAAASRSDINVRALVITGTSPSAVSQYAATSSGGISATVALSIAEIGVGTMVLAGESSSASDNTKVFSIGGITAVEGDPSGSGTSGVAYREFASGGGSLLSADFKGYVSGADRVLVALYLDSGVLLSASRTEEQASKVTGYALLGSVTDSASVSKLNSYAMLGAVPDQVSVSKMGGYALLGSVPDQVSLSKIGGYAIMYEISIKLPKLTSYAVLGGYENGITNVKTVAYAVLGGALAFQSLGKMVAYAVIEINSSLVRPQVFTCT